MAHNLKQYIATLTDVAYTGKVYDINTGSIKLLESILMQPQLSRHSYSVGLSCMIYFYEKDFIEARKLAHETLRLEVVKVKKEFDMMYNNFIHHIKEG